jgi:hypothetical protein
VISRLPERTLEGAANVRRDSRQNITVEGDVDCCVREADAHIDRVNIDGSVMSVEICSRYQGLATPYRKFGVVAGIHCDKMQSDVTPFVQNDLC